MLSASCALSIAPFASPPTALFARPLSSRLSCPSFSALPFLSPFNRFAPFAVAQDNPTNCHTTPTTLLSFLVETSNDDMVILFSHLQIAVKQISALLALPSSVMATSSNSPSKPLEIVLKEGLRKSDSSLSSTARRDVPKPLDLISNDILKDALSKSKKVAVMASEEDELPTWLGNSGPYVVVFDPLDGSRNIDASIPTGTIFRVYRRLEELDERPNEEKALVNVLQRGERLVAAGYVLYSSATIFCVSVGRGAHAFTLDHTAGEFVLTHPDLIAPPRGQIYSVNDARYFEWPKGLQQYVDSIRQGKGQYPKKYSARYICSLVADFHRTLLYGGVAMNPRAHLRLVYEANPLSFIVEQANGKGSNGKKRILDIQPVELHQRLPLFLGSSQDVLELESYEDIQQLVNPGYEV